MENTITITNKHKTAVIVHHYFKDNTKEGNEKYTEELGCKGCYQYDPVEYRKASVNRIAKEASKNTSEFIMKKLLKLLLVFLLLCGCSNNSVDNVNNR